jgi:hypothetical protein
MQRSLDTDIRNPNTAHQPFTEIRRETLPATHLAEVSVTHYVMSTYKTTHNIPTIQNPNLNPNH